MAPSEQSRLTDLVTLAVETILDQKPLRPRELEGKPEAEIKRERDLVNLRWYFRHISIDLLGLHVRDMPDMLHYFAITMSDGLEGVVSSPSFRLYDEPLEDLLRSLHRDLKASISFDHVYRDTNSLWVHALGLRGGRNFQQESEAAEKIRTIMASLAQTLSRVVSTIRERYIEIDLEETSAVFSRNYREMVASVESGSASSD